MSIISGFNWRDGDLIEKMNHEVCGCEFYTSNTFSEFSYSFSKMDQRKAIFQKNYDNSPIFNETGSIMLVSDTDIYNYEELRQDLEGKGHTFHSDDSAEVIVHIYEEYGMHGLNRINGIFAFCLIDTNENRFILSRDCFGVRPLYYYTDTNQIIFSSVISAIQAHNIPQKPNYSTIRDYLAFNLTNHSENTFFETIMSVPSGGVIYFDLDTGTPTRDTWYTITPKQPLTEEEILDTFINNVRFRTVGSDSVGIGLSGGVDSSSMAMVLNSIDNLNVSSYSLIAPGTPLDESKYIEEIGKNTNISQFFTSIEQGAFFDDLPSLIRAQEEPITGLGVYSQYCVYKLAHENGCTNLFDGLGSDELFGGHLYTLSYYYYELFLEMRFMTLIQEMNKYKKTFGTTRPTVHFLYLLLPDRIKYHLWKKSYHTWIDYAFFENECQKGFDPRWKKMDHATISKIILTSVGTPHLLRVRIKNAIRWGIDMKFPFLDATFVESSLSIPLDEKMNNGETKVIWRQSVKELLPKMIQERTDKIGFGTPSDDFFRNESTARFCEEILYSEQFSSRPFWDAKKIQSLFEQHQTKKVNIGDTIWKWIHLELWMREFFEKDRYNEKGSEKPSSPQNQSTDTGASPMDSAGD